MKLLQLLPVEERVSTVLSSLQDLLEQWVGYPDHGFHQMLQQNPEVP